jgi:hypothetical protein
MNRRSRKFLLWLKGDGRTNVIESRHRQNESTFETFKRLRDRDDDPIIQKLYEKRLFQGKRL